MLFNSLQFLIFFPIVTILYFLLPGKVRWVWLLLSSIYFYACWKAKYILLIGFSILVTWVGACLLQRLRPGDAEPPDKNRGRRKIILCLVLIANLGVLFVFKYYGFFAENLLALTGLEMPALNLLLPVGISFYTFQALGYCVDVYQGTIAAEKNLFRYALFISFFPQLVAGPIERATNLLPQVKKPTSFDFVEMQRGMLLIGWGLFCKMVVSDRLAIFVDAAYSNAAETDGAFLLLATILFALQIYCDFSGYSNIARGAAQVLGFRLMKNFDLPYFSRSISEFWQRWHISLSQWFMDYLYAPIVWSSRNPAKAVYCGFIVVFLASGLWHGAAWTFVIWGLIHALYRVIGAATKKPRRKLYKKLGINLKSRWFGAGQVLCTFLLVDFTYIFFRSGDLAQATLIIQRILFHTHLGQLFSADIFSFGLPAAEWGVAVAALAVLWGVEMRSQKADLRSAFLGWRLPVRWALGLGLIAVLALFGVYGPQYDSAPFIYFQF